MGGRRLIPAAEARKRLEALVVRRTAAVAA
jgi:hypothetical protein